MMTYAVKMPDGSLVPLVVTPPEWKALIGDRRSLNSIRNDCQSGAIPTLPRRHAMGSSYRIPTVRALEALGIKGEVVTLEDEQGHG